MTLLLAFSCPCYDRTNQGQRAADWLLYLRLPPWCQIVTLSRHCISQRNVGVPVARPRHRPAGVLAIIHLIIRSKQVQKLLPASPSHFWNGSRTRKLCKHCWRPISSEKCVASNDRAVWMRCLLAQGHPLTRTAFKLFSFFLILILRSLVLYPKFVKTAPSIPVTWQRKNDWCDAALTTRRFPLESMVTPLTRRAHMYA